LGRRLKKTAKPKEAVKVRSAKKHSINSFFNFRKSTQALEVVQEKTTIQYNTIFT